MKFHYYGHSCFSLSANYHNDYATLALPDGVYTWQLLCKGQMIENGKLIKQ